MMLLRRPRSGLRLLGAVLIAGLAVAAPTSAGTVLRPPVALLTPPAAAPNAPLQVALADAHVQGTGSRVEGGTGVIVRAGPGPSMVGVPLGIDSTAYTVLRLTMRHHGGRVSAVQFHGPGRDPSRTPPLPVMIQPDGAQHTYEVDLASAASSGWYGRVDSMAVICPDPVDFEVTAVEFVDQTPTGPREVTLSRETHVAVPEAGLAWEVDVPERAVLQSYVGVRSRATFLCEIAAAGQAPTEMYRATVGPEAIPPGGQWQSVRIPLDEFAAQQCTVRLLTEGSMEGGGYWAEPVIYARQAPATARPVILISNDTLRADHLGCYGYGRETSPVLDAFAREAVVFENAVSEEPGTLQAHMTMLTGLHPLNHGLTMRPRRQGTPNRLAEDVETLAQCLRGSGYVNAGFVGVGHILDPARGFSRGFDLWSTPETFRSILDTRTMADPWLAAHAEAPFFLFFHNYDIHSRVDGRTWQPYFPVREEDLHFSRAFDPPPTLERPGSQDLRASAFLMAVNAGQIAPPDAREREFLLALYDDGIRSVDAIHAGFFDMLKARGIYDEALIIVTADHGESFGEHELYVHSDIYETCAHVPLMVRFPHAEHAGTRVRALVQLADLMPTILEFVGASEPDGLDGVSLFRAIEGAETERDHVDVVLGPWTGVRTADWKLIHNDSNGRRELYHVSDDPGETKDLSGEAPSIQAELLAALEVMAPPERGGWHLRFRSAPDVGAAARIDLVCQAPSGLVSQAVRLGDPTDQLRVEGDGRTLQGMLNLREGDVDEVVFEPRSAEEAVSVHLRSSLPVRVQYGETTAESAEWTGELRQTESRGARPDAAGEESAPLVVDVWYDLDPPQRLLGVDLTDEQEEHLRALGYVD